MSDRDLVPVIEAGSYVFVTNNRQDFLNLHGAMPLHAGLVIILPSVRRDEQARLFNLALDRLDQLGDLVNQVLEVDAAGAVTVRLLAAPGL